jgi:hypothetical protein
MARLGIVESQVAREGQILDGRPGAARVLPYAVHRIVIVGCQQERRVRAKWIGFRDEFDRGARVRRETDDVVVAGVEEAQHPPADAIHDGGARERRTVLRVRIAQHQASEPHRMRGDLRVGVERGAPVVEIRDPLRVEARELLPPEVGEERIREAGRRQHLFLGAGQHPLGGL